MADQPFTVEHSRLVKELGRVPQATFSTVPLTATWLDEQGDAIEGAQLEDVVLPPAEWAGKKSVIKAAAGDQLITSRKPPPTGAQSIQFRRGNAVATFAAKSDVEPWTATQRTSPFGSGNEQFEIRVFSELFGDFARFQARVSEFYDALRQVVPFTAVDAAGKLRVVGHYASSPGAGGHFRTVVTVKPGERRVYGDPEYARGRLAPSLNKMPALILIDSEVGGGAGGALGNGRPYWPAWASTASMGKGTSWLQVAIHELAHGFGLSDEYIDAKMAARKLPPQYPNVSNAQFAESLSWNDLAALPPPTPLPTHNGTGLPTGAIGPGRELAAYIGAYYADNFWRPSLNCRMRNYEPGGFCRVCSRIIRQIYEMA
jgi:hypothetical protein